MEGVGMDKWYIRAALIVSLTRIVLVVLDGFQRWLSSLLVKKARPLNIPVHF
jgi:hypothetical protein